MSGFVLILCNFFLLIENVIIGMLVVLIFWLFSFLQNGMFELLLIVEIMVVLLFCVKVLMFVMMVW